MLEPAYLKLISSLLPGRCGAYSLRNKIFRLSGNAVIESPAIDGRKLSPKVAVSRRVRRRPLQSGSVPRIPLGRVPPKENTPEEIEHEDQLRRTENECEDRDEHIERLLRLQERVLSWIINTPHHSADSQDVHREKYAIDSDETEPEVDLTQRFVQEATEHFGEPVIKTRKSCKERSDGHYEVKMCYDKVCVLKLDIGR